MKRSARARWLTVLMLAAGWVAPVAAQDPPPLSAATVEAWADQLFSEAAGGKRFSGAVISFVQNGEVAFARGYGYADYVAGTPVDPAATAFRIGSISKTFTATAIARLIDQGSIASLDDPANLYLKRLQLPSPGGQQITLRQLITHTAGLENPVFNIATDQAFDLPLSADVVQSFAAEVVNEPGRYASYNNFGTAVLGIVVEDVTGIPIADYFARYIFQPLGMNHTVLNMSPEPTPGLGVSYGFLPSGEPLLTPHRTVHPFYAPVGGINSTGEDMARFMLAQLDGGQSTSAFLLSPAAFRLMHTRIAGNHPLGSGFGMIFFTWEWNGVRMILHGGDWPGTHSGMLLFPDLNAGVFFSLMADFPEVPMLESITGSERLKPREGVTVETPLTNIGVIADFLTHFFGPLRAPRREGFVAGDAGEYEGSYVGQSATHTTMGVMLRFTNPFTTVRVEPGEAGGLMINGRGPYEQVAPDVFWSDEVPTPLDGYFLDSPLYLFSRDENGAVNSLTPMIGFDAWVKKGWWATPSTYLTAWAFLGLFLLSGLLCLFYPRVPAHPFVKWVPVLAAVAVLGMPAVLVLGYGGEESLLSDVFFGHRSRFVCFALLAHGVVALALVGAWNAVQSWKQGYWGGRFAGRLMRVHYTALSLAALMLIPVFAYSNLLGL